MTRCEACGQPIATAERAGIRMSPLKAAIFDAIKAAGDVGITSVEIVRGQVYRDRRRVSHSAIKSHCFQINELLERTLFVIVSDRRRWFLERRKQKRRAA